MREVAVQYGTTPLDYLLAVMRDEDMPTEVRIAAAKAALPYCTPRLASVRVQVGVAARTHEDWVRELTREDPA